MEVGSFLIVRVIAVSPVPSRGQNWFIVLRVGGQIFTSQTCDENGCFCEQFVFDNVLSNICVDLILKRPWPFFDKKLGTGVFDPKLLQPETVSCQAISVGAASLQVLLLKTTRRLEEEDGQHEEVVDEDDFVVLPTLLLQEPKAPVAVAVAADAADEAKTLSGFLDEHPLKCLVCSGDRPKIWLDCLHVYCSDCFRKLALEPDCSCPGGACQAFPDWAMRRALSEAEMSTMEAKRLEQAISVVGQLDGRVSCPRCSYVFLAADTSVSSKFRCRECLYGWCIKCAVTPFHDGLSCEQYAEHLLAPKCRFCKAHLKEKQMACCSECTEKLKVACPNVRSDCGHLCSGVSGEKPCLKDCLQCSEQGDEFCTICYCEDLRSQPVLQMDCGHKFHHLCWIKQVESGFPRLRVTFGHIQCPLCKVTFSCASHPSVQEAVGKWIALEKKVNSMALTRLGIEGRLREVGHEVPEAYAARIYSYYICRQCSNPFFAGLAVCGDGDEAGSRLCDDCTPRIAASCRRHSPEFHTYKCRFCCRPSTFKCWNTYSFCDSCHTKQVNGNYLSRKPKTDFPVCKGAAYCPLGVDHPHVEEFFLSCSICNSMKGF